MNRHARRGAQRVAGPRRAASDGANGTLVHDRGQQADERARWPTPADVEDEEEPGTARLPVCGQAESPAPAPSRSVPRLGAEVTSSEPPRAARRPRMCRCCPTPERGRHLGVETRAVVTDREHEMTVRFVRRTVTFAPAACLAALFSASRQAKYTAASTSPGYRPTPSSSTVTCTARVGLLAAQRRRQPVHGEHWRVDALSQVVQGRQRLGDDPPQVSADPPRPVGVAARRACGPPAAAPSVRRGTAARHRGCRARPVGARRPGWRRSARATPGSPPPGPRSPPGARPARR